MKVIISFLGSVQQKAVAQSKQGAIQDKFPDCKMKTLMLSKFSLPFNCQMHYRHARLNINPSKISLLKLQRGKCLCTHCSWERWQNFLLLYFSCLLSFTAESCTVTNYSNLKSELCCNMFFLTWTSGDLKVTHTAKQWIKLVIK